MALRTAAMNYWRTVGSRNGGRTFATTAMFGGSTKPKMGKKGDYVPVYVALGLIMLSLGFGAHTAFQQLRYAPAVLVSKKKREELVEVEDPDYVVDKADKFINKSWFRKVAHVQDYSPDENKVIPDSIRADIYSRPVKAETLKSVGVETGKH